jgi:hypothetical protein
MKTYWKCFYVNDYNLRFSYIFVKIFATFFSRPEICKNQLTSLSLKSKTGFSQDGDPVTGTNLVVVVLEPLNGLLVANPLEGFLGRLEVGVEFSDQVAQGMLQHSAGKLTFISSRKSVFRSIVDQTLVSSRKRVQR